MKNFKPNQKVVFKYNGLSTPFVTIPKENEILTIKSKCDTFPNSWDVYEYPKRQDGAPQSFSEKVLFPIEEVFSEQSQEDIESEIEQEQLITVTP